MRLILSDFDGTITYKDSLFDFLLFSLGWKKLFFGGIILSPILIGYSLKIIPNDIAKETIIGYFFTDWDEGKFLKIAKEYAERRLDKIVRKSAIKTLLEYQKDNSRVIIVSASAESWLQSWCEKYGFELIATKLAFKEGRVTGKFATKNCHGNEKMVRIRDAINLKEYSEIVAFGDTKGDLPMLSLADKAFYKPFR